MYPIVFYRLLRGDYCLENDLQKDPVQKQGQLNIPDEMLCAIFESYEDSDEERGIVYSIKYLKLAKVIFTLF